MAEVLSKIVHLSDVEIDAKPSGRLLSPYQVILEYLPMLSQRDLLQLELKISTIRKSQ